MTEELKTTQPKSTLEASDRQTDEAGVEIWNDQAALKILEDHVNRCDSYMNLNQWAAGWAQTVILYQSPVSASAFKNGVLRASVPSYTLSDHLSSITPKIVNGLFYEDPPFLLRPEPTVSQEIVRAKTIVLSTQLREGQFRSEAERAIEQMAMFGTCIMKYFFKIRKEKVKRYVLKGDKLNVPTKDGSLALPTEASEDFKIESDEVTTYLPILKFCDLRTVLVDPGCRVGDIRKAKKVAHREFMSFDDLDGLRDQPGYNIPSREALRQFFMADKSPKTGIDNMTLVIPEGMRGWLQTAVPRNAPTGDPLLDGVEVIEYWDAKQVVVAICYKSDYILIRNESHDNGEVPFLSSNWRNIPDAFYGQGLGLLVGSEQMVEQGIRNLALDLLAYGLQPTVIRKKGFNAPTQDIVMGTQKIINVDDDVDKAFKFLEMPSVPSEAWQFLQNSAAKAQASSGANENFTMGVASAGVRSTGARSGTGAQLVGQAQASRLDGPMERFQNQIFVPWLYKMDALNNQYLPTSALGELFGSKMSPDEARAVDHLDYRNAKIRFEVLAGSHLGPKREMAQFLPFLLQLINNPTFETMITQAGYTFDAVAVFKAFTDAAGWKYSQSFLRKMTPEEQQRANANTPSALQAQKGQIAQQTDDRKFQQTMQQIDEDAMAKGTSVVLRDIVEKGLENGNLGAGTQGFGGEE